MFTYLTEKAISLAVFNIIYRCFGSSVFLGSTLCK